MTTYTHKLPPHLGGWPCRPLGTRASDGLTPLLTLVEYAVQAPQEPKVKRIFVDEDELTEVVPPEPDDLSVWQYQYEDAITLWQRNDGRAQMIQAGEGERWFGTGHPKPLTWPALAKLKGTWTQYIQDPAPFAPNYHPYAIEHHDWRLQLTRHGEGVVKAYPMHTPVSLGVILADVGEHWAANDGLAEWERELLDGTAREARK